MREFAGKCVEGIGLAFDACLLIGLLCHVNWRERAYPGLGIRLKLDLLIGLGRLESIRPFVSMYAMQRMPKASQNALFQLCTGLLIISCVLTIIILLSLPGMEHNSAEYLHTVIEALSLSFADTLWYNADPSKIQVPVSGLLSKDYAAKRRSLIRQDRLVKILYSRTSCERPTRIRRFRGRIRELVAYESRPTGGLF